METKVMFCGRNGDKRKATRYNRAAAGEEDVNSDFELDSSDLLVIKSSILYCFNDKFIPFLKSGIESEEGITL
jgi:hypothetical protein